MTGEIGLHATPHGGPGRGRRGAAPSPTPPPPRTYNNTKGLVQAFDVRTGRRLWTFDTVPGPGEPGVETWLNDSWGVNGNNGVWTQISADPELGIAYLPVETPSGDYYGGHRPGDNLFGESLVAVDLLTGERLWHFQLVHHPLWGFDMASPPILADITVDGRPVKAVAQPGKQAFLYVFDRVTGEPVWAHRGAAGARGATCPASGTRRPSRSPRSRRPTTGRGRPSRTSSTSPPSCGPRRWRWCRATGSGPSSRRPWSAGRRAPSPLSASGPGAGAPTGPAAATTPRRTCSTCRRAPRSTLGS